MAAGDVRRRVAAVLPAWVRRPLGERRMVPMVPNPARNHCGRWPAASTPTSGVSNARATAASSSPPSPPRLLVVAAFVVGSDRQLDRHHRGRAAVRGRGRRPRWVRAPHVGAHGTGPWATSDPDPTPCRGWTTSPREQRATARSSRPASSAPPRAASSTSSRAGSSSREHSGRARPRVGSVRAFRARRQRPRCGGLSQCSAAPHERPHVDRSTLHSWEPAFARLTSSALDAMADAADAVSGVEPRPRVRALVLAAWTGVLFGIADDDRVGRGRGARR